MSQIQTFSMTTAGRIPAPQTRRAADVFPTKAKPGVSLRMALSRLRSWRVRRAERAALATLLEASDHILDDIGISRHELHAMLDGL